jgi:hypothetical protein
VAVTVAVAVAVAVAIDTVDSNAHFHNSPNLLLKILPITHLKKSA